MTKRKLKITKDEAFMMAMKIMENERIDSLDSLSDWHICMYFNDADVPETPYNIAKVRKA